MTAIAVDAVVNITRDPTVFGISSGFGVTACAGKYGVICGICVTGGAGNIGYAMLGIEPSVIKVCSEPGDRRMTCSAGGRESGGGVIWVCGPRKVHLVAGIAVSWSSNKYIVYVA